MKRKELLVSILGNKASLYICQKGGVKMGLIIINTKDLRTQLEHFASDLVNYCAIVKDSEIKLPDKAYKEMLEGYLEVISTYELEKGEKQI